MFLFAETNPNGVEKNTEKKEAKVVKDQKRKAKQDAPEHHQIETDHEGAGHGGGIMPPKHCDS